MLRADFAAEKIESLDIVNQSIEVKIFEIGARRRNAFRRIGTIAAPACLLACNELAIETAHVIGEKSAAMARAEF